MTEAANGCTFFVLNAAWQLPALLLVIVCLTHLLPALPYRLQHRLWVGCLLVAVAAPCVSASLALLPARLHPRTLRSDDPRRWKVPQPPPTGPLTLHLTEMPLGRASSSPQATVLSSLYLCTVLFGCARLLRRLLRTRQIVRRASPLADGPAFDALLEQWARLTPHRTAARSPRLCTTLDLASPATVTWPTPLILVPPSFLALPADEVTALLAHELAHVRRRDFEGNLALEALAVLLIFHPATRWLQHRIAESRELVCDELAAASTSGASAYARSLVSLAHRVAGHAPAPPTLSLGVTGSTSLERRIMHLVRAPHLLSRPRRLLLTTLSLAALFAAGLALIPLSLHPSSVHAATSPAFPFDPTQTFDALIPPSSRQPAPNFTLIDNHGNTITLSAYRGKVVLLDFRATWCGGCKLEIPWYMEFDRQYRAAGLAAIGVSMDDKGWAVVRPFLAKRKDEETGGIIAMQYPVVLGTDALAKSFGLTSMPMTLLIDRDGKITVSHTGVVDKEDFEHNLQTLLKEQTQRQ